MVSRKAPIDPVRPRKVDSWTTLMMRPDDDVKAFALIVLSYVGDEAPPGDLLADLLDGDRELRRRARAVLHKLDGRS